MTLVKVPIKRGYSSRETSRAQYAFKREEALLKERVRLLSGFGIVVSMGLAIILVCLI